MSHDEPEDDRPWTEEQWEKFMNESDVRSAKFGELLETFMDHPDRDAIIDREMGWDKDDEDDGIERPWLDEIAESQVGEEIADEDLREAEDELRREDDELERMPAYSRAFDFGLRVHDAIKPYFIEDQEDQDEDLVAATGNAFTIAAKLAGAHGMGYEDDVLCGNIVRCKKSLAAADECLMAMRLLRDRKAVPAQVLDPLIREGEEVRKLVDEHISQLRSKVWWE